MVSSFLACAYIYLDAVLGCTFQTLARTCLIVIVDDIDLSTSRTTIAGALCIIDDAVAEIYILCLDGVLLLIGVVILVAGVFCPSVTGTVEAGTTVHQMAQEVVVEAG